MPESGGNEKPAVAKVGRRVFRFGVLTPTPEGETLTARTRCGRKGCPFPKGKGAGHSDRTGQGGEGAALLAAGLLELVALGEHAIKFVHEKVDGLVAVVGGDGSVEVGAIHRDMALCGEAVGDGLLRIALEFDPHTDDSLLVTEEAVGFVMNELLQGRGEFEVDAGDDQVVVIHDFFWIWVYLGQKGCEAGCMRTLREEMSEYSVIIVTGGSSGIGKAFIEHAVKLNPEAVICNLSRREPAIISAELKLRHTAVNLANPVELQDAAASLLAYLREAAPTGRILLVNNSGFGGYGRSDELDREHQLEMIDLNVRAVVDLTSRLLPELRRRGGVVVNIASTAAFQPTAFMATYGATKAFLLHWSLALNEELRGFGVRALAVCPGPTATEFFRRAGLKQGAVSDRFGQTSDDVVLTTLRALAAGRPQVVSGWGNWFVATFASRLPKPWAARVGAALLAKFRLSRVAATTDGGVK